MWASQGWAQKVGYPDGSGPQLVDPRLLVIPGGESQVSAPQCDRAVSHCGEPQGEGPTEIGTKEWAQLQGVGLWGWARGGWVRLRVVGPWIRGTGVGPRLVGIKRVGSSGEPYLGMFSGVGWAGPKGLDTKG